MSRGNLDHWGQLKGLVTDVAAFLIICAVYSFVFWLGWRFALVPVFELRAITYHQWFLMVMIVPTLAHAIPQIIAIARRY